MSNFDFGGGPAPTPTTPIAHQVPQQPDQQPVVSAPDAQPPVPPAAPVRDSGGGIGRVGIISLLALIAVMLGVAWQGNRFYPVRASIDSAWRGLDGNAAELTNALRAQGFTCSDEHFASDVKHIHRLCGRYATAGSQSIEFSGPPSGEIMRLRFASDRPVTEETRAGVDKAIELTVPDTTSQRAVRALLAQADGRTPVVEGPWGSATHEEGVLSVARTWPGVDVGAVIPGSVDEVRAKASAAGYLCDPAATPLVCRRIANGGNWMLTATPAEHAPGTSLSLVRLEATVTDDARLDPAAELETVVPPSAERNRIRWFVSTAGQAHGHAGFPRGSGLIVDYRVTRTGKDRSGVVIDTRSPCVSTGAKGTC